MPIADLNILLGADISKFDKGLRDAQGQLKKTARALQGVADGIFRNISVPFVAAAGAGTKLFVDLDTNFSKIENLVGVTGDSLAKLKTGVESISGTTAQSQKELSDALFDVTSAGLRGSDALAVLEKSAKGSAVGMGSAKDIAGALTSVLAAYGTENISAAQSAELLFKTVREGKVDAASLVPVIGDVLPIASALKVSFADLGANIALYTKITGNAPKAVTGLKAALSAILKPTEQAKEALAGVGITVADLKESIEKEGLAKTFVNLKKAFEGNEEGLAKVFGSVEGLSNVLAVAGVKAEEYIQISGKMNTETDLLEKAMTNSSKKIGFVLKQAFVDGKNSLLVFGDAFAPLVIKMATGLSSITKVFTGLSDSTKKNLITLGAFAASMGIALKGASLLTRGLVNTIGAVRGATALFGQAWGAVLRFDTALTAVKTKEAVGNFGRLTAVIKSSAQAFKALNIVTKLSLIGLAIGTVVALGATYSSLSGALDATTSAQKANAKVTAQAKAEIIKEKTETAILVKILKNETTSREKKEKALNRLKQINPTYFGQLEIEKGRVEGLTTAYGKYGEAILRQAKVRAASNIAQKINEEIFESEENLARLQRGELTAFEKVTKGLEMAVFHRTTAISKEKKNIDDLKKKLEEYNKIFETVFTQNLDDPLSTKKKKKVVKKKKPTFDTEQIKEALAEFDKAIKLSETRLIVYGDQYAVLNEKISAHKNLIDSLLKSGEDPTGERITNLKTGLEELELGIKKLDRGAKLPVLEKLPTLFSGISDQTDLLKNKIKKVTFREFRKGMAEANVSAIAFGDAFDLVSAKTSLIESAIQNLISNGFDEADPAIQQLIASLKLLKAESNISLKIDVDTSTSFGGAVKSALENLKKQGIEIGDGLEKGLTEAAEAGAHAVQALSGLFSAVNDKKRAELDEDYEKQRTRIEATVEDEGKKQAALESLENKYNRKKKELAKKEAVSAKLGAISQSIINTAVAVTKVVANPILATIVGALGAAQTAVIAATPTGFAKGGKIKKAIGKITGPTNAPYTPDGDHILAYLKYGEAVLNKKQIGALGGPGILASIGVPGFAGGGGVFSPGVSPAILRSPLSASDGMVLRAEFGKVEIEGDTLVAYVEDYKILSERTKGY